MNWLFIFLFFCFSVLGLFMFFFSISFSSCVFWGRVSASTFFVVW